MTPYLSFRTLQPHPASLITAGPTQVYSLGHCLLSLPAVYCIYFAIIRAIHATLPLSLSILRRPFRRTSELSMFPSWPPLWSSTQHASASRHTAQVQAATFPSRPQQLPSSFAILTASWLATALSPTGPALVLPLGASTQLTACVPHPLVRTIRASSSHSVATPCRTDSWDLPRLTSASPAQHPASLALFAASQAALPTKSPASEPVAVYPPSLVYVFRGPPFKFDPDLTSTFVCPSGSFQSQPATKFELFWPPSRAYTFRP